MTSSDSPQDGDLGLLSQLRGSFTTTAMLSVTLLVVLFTYATTRALRPHRHTAKDPQGLSAEPAHAPYTIPWLANTLSFARDPEGYIGRMQQRMSGAPFRLRIAGEKWLFCPAGDLTSAMLRSRDMGTKLLMLRSIRDQFGMPTRDLTIWSRDDSGIRPKPAPGFEDWPRERRAHFTQHRDLHDLLMGVSLNGMTRKYVAILSRQLRHQSSDMAAATEWTALPDLYDFLRRHMFLAASRAMCGDLLLETCPNLVDEFWDFDRALVYLMRRVPRWLAPRHHGARDRMLASIKRWHTSARERFDWDDKEAMEADWEPIFGAKLIRARQKMFRDTGHSLDGSASLDLGMLWAANANIIPATFWSLAHILLRPYVLSGVRAEIDASLHPGTHTLDMATLGTQPLLGSIYLETLRYSVATGVWRNPATSGGSGPVRVGPWTVPADTTAFSISWFGAHDAAFWNDGPAGRYPVDVFWPERFLQFADDPMSGPIKRTDGVGADKNKEQERPRKPEDYKLATVVTAGIQGHLYPYGGGEKMCPGRFFAKQEMLASLALLLHEFEVELVDAGAAAGVQPDKRYFLLGAMPPDRALPARIRRRVFDGDAGVSPEYPM